MLYYVEAGVPGAWADPGNIQSVVVDEAPGTPFEARAVDLNLDGEFSLCFCFVPGAIPRAIVCDLDTLRDVKYAVINCYPAHSPFSLSCYTNMNISFAM